MGRGLLALLVAVLIAIVSARSPVAHGDGTSVARSTDAVAKEREDEFNELKKKDTLAATRRRMEILQSLQFAACPTSQRFLLGLLKRSSVGDERLYSLLTLVKIVDEQGLEDLLALLAREKDPVIGQAFGEALADRLSPTVAKWLAGPALDTSHVPTLLACLEGLSRRPQADLVPRVAVLYAKHGKAPAGVEVAHRALRALVAARVGDVRKTLLEAARHAQWTLRLVAADALPEIEPFDAEVEAAVRGLLQDESPVIRQTAAARAGVFRRQALAPVLVAMLASDARVRTRHVASVALEQISGLKLGHDVPAWTAWLEQRDPGQPQEIAVPTYHGFSVQSDRVVFLVDGSSSMTWPWKKPVHRIDVARAELASVLRRITPDTLFNVVVFAEKPLPWKKAEVAASPENVAAAMAWAEKALAQPDGETHLFEALDTVFANDPQFDTIFLLTDGNPTAGRYWTLEGLLAGVRTWTRYRRTAIHAVGLTLAEEDRGAPNLTEDLGLMATILGAIARETSGEYREVLRAPAAK